MKMPRQGIVWLMLLLLCGVLGCDNDDELEIVTDTLPNGIVGARYFFEFETDGDADVFRLVSGDLPPGLGLADDGELSGIPTTPGTFFFTIEVLNLDFEGFILESVAKGFSLAIVE
jgi:hypothetical protein